MLIFAARAVGYGNDVAALICARTGGLVRDQILTVRCVRALKCGGAAMSNRFLTGWGDLRLADVVRGVLVLLRLVRRPDLSGFVMDHHPSDDALREGALVVVADGERRKWACFRCPGGCGGKIQLTLNDLRRPHWTASLDWLGRPTVYPSIRQLNKCGCHFWVKGGRVEWCTDGDMSAKSKPSAMRDGPGAN